LSPFLRRPADYKLPAIVGDTLLTKKLLLEISRYVVLWSSLLYLLSGFSVSIVAEEVTSATVRSLADDLQFLASDELAGRDVGSPGIIKAGEFIAKRFDALGLRTDSFDGTPFQYFTIPGLSQLGDPADNTLIVSSLDTQLNWQLGIDFMPLSLGSSGQFAGPLVFAGYGITAPDLNYDDYADLDVTDKVVLILRKQPGQRDPNSRFGSGSSQYAYFSSKELNAALHKAAALLIINDYVTVEAAGQDQLLEMSQAGAAVSDSQIPTLFCLRSAVEPLIQQATGQSLSELEHAIDRDFSPHSHVLENISVRGQTRFEQTPVRNVVGYLPGVGELAHEYVVVGAHYDHVGMGGLGSLAPGTIEVHNGADDNASGTTALLEVAKRLTNSQFKSRRGVVFIAFTGEERGLLGSAHYVRNPRWALENTVAMVNMDMVGRLENNTLIVYGTGTAVGFDGLLDRFNSAAGFNLQKEPAGFGPSDHASFYGADIPVFHFFTGLHNDYHRPSDDFEKINMEGLARIAAMVTDVVSELATVPERPQLLKTSQVAKIDNGSGASQVAGRGSSRRPRAVIGIQLDASSDFATVAGLSPGGPADSSGLLAGDRITRVDEDAIASASDLLRILSNKRPGDSISVTVLRGEQRIKFELTLVAG
jgi:hypothetical protein